MPRKAFHVGIDLDIHAVSCPGVWLCPKGDTMLQISLLGATTHTKRIEPTFPLLFHENFHFRKTFIGITSLAGLQGEFEKCQVQIQLIQWQVHGCRCVQLAVFRSHLSEVLYPQPASQGLVTGVDIDLLMEPTACFPGIIAPKVEISTRVVIEEMVNYPIHDHDSLTIKHKTLPSKKTGLKKDGKFENKSKTKTMLRSGCNSRMRQKPVCHTRPNVKCYYCKQKVDRTRKTYGIEKRDGQCDCDNGRPPTANEQTMYTPYCTKCRDITGEKEVGQGKIITKESSHRIGKSEAACVCVDSQSAKSICDCNLCHKYQNLFKNSTLSPRDSTLLQDSKLTKWRFDSSLSPSRKEKCPCLQDKFADGPARLKAGADCPHSGCPCVYSSHFADSINDNRDIGRGQIQKAPKDDEYRKLFKADLDAHYSKLYQRVSRRSNCREC